LGVEIHQFGVLLIAEIDQASLMPIGHDQQVSVVVGILVHDHEGVFETAEEQSFAVVPVVLKLTEDTALGGFAEFLDELHPPRSPQVTHG
jgi:hypothetical protein